MSWEVRQGDCVEAMRQMDECSVDAVVCDPPYLLGFMGKEFDSQHRGFRRAENPADAGRDDVFGRTSRTSPEYVGEGQAMQAWHQAWAEQALRVLKPGGHLLAFGGTRTYHRLACAVEDAGFEVRDTIAWMYGSGFPKSLNVGAAIDKAAGAEREVVGTEQNWGASKLEDGKTGYGDYAGEWNRTAPATPEAEQWQGWGTALKPAHEPIVVARKPLSGTVAACVLEFGTGALNVDATRVGTDAVGWGGKGAGGNTWNEDNCGLTEDGEPRPAVGRWPPNVALGCECAVRDDPSGTPVEWPERQPMGALEDGETSPNTSIVPILHFPDCPVRLLDEQTGELVRATSRTDTVSAGMFHGGDAGTVYPDAGGPSRFFYVAKASRSERNAGLEGFEEQPSGLMEDDGYDWERERERGRQPRNTTARNVHPTVKPIELMRWLVRLVTPPNGTVLDCFAGSGTTGCACALEGFDFVGLEREQEYVDIARARIGWWHKHRGDGEAAAVLAAGAERDAVEATGQLGMFEDIR